MARSANERVSAAPEEGTAVLLHHPDEAVDGIVRQLTKRGVPVSPRAGAWDADAQRAIDTARCVLVALGPRGLDRDAEDAAHYAALQRGAGFLAALLVAVLPGATPPTEGTLARATLVDLRADPDGAALDRLASLALGRTGRFASNELEVPALLEGSKHFSFPELPWGLILTAVVTLVAALWMLSGD